MTRKGDLKPNHLQELALAFLFHEILVTLVMRLLQSFKPSCKSRIFPYERWIDERFGASCQLPLPQQALGIRTPEHFLHLLELLLRDLIRPKSRIYGESYRENQSLFAD